MQMPKRHSQRWYRLLWSGAIDPIHEVRRLMLERIAEYERETGDLTWWYVKTKHKLLNNEVLSHNSNPSVELFCYAVQTLNIPRRWSDKLIERMFDGTWRVVHNWTETQAVD